MNPKELKKLENTLWHAADMLRANSDLKSTEYSTPVLGLIFLKFADNKYSRYEKEIQEECQRLKATRLKKDMASIAIAKCGFYLPEKARYSYLLNLPDEVDIAKAIKEAMAAIESYKDELQGVLPQDEYSRLTRTDKSMLKTLLKNFSTIPKDMEGDMFGQIYEYFLANFARAEGQKGGEFFTPRPVVRLMVEIIEPHEGTVYDPACGSAGMFVQSSQFIRRRVQYMAENPAELSNLFVYGQEKTLETVKLAKMNIAVNGLRGDIRQANSYYEDPFGCFGKFDFVLANPPFNVDDVNLGKVETERRFNTYGLPKNKSKNAATRDKEKTADKKNKSSLETIPNANYLWISLFATSLKPGGRAGLVMANSASDARHSEMEMRKNLITQNLIYAIVTLPSNMFFTVTLPATLWFFDKGKTDERILFIDARNIFVQVDRAHREFSEEQIQNIAMISRLFHGRRDEFIQLIDTYFKTGMERLVSYKEPLRKAAVTLKEFLEQYHETNIPDFTVTLGDIQRLEEGYAAYVAASKGRGVEQVNQRQRELAGMVAPFFGVLHEKLKVMDRKVNHFEKEQGKRNSREAKLIKDELDNLHQEIKMVEEFFLHILWLQERFPAARYEDVTGLCKLATLAEVAEQDYSLNPGRYVGVVIEEDGKTEEEFMMELVALHEELNALNQEAHQLEAVIAHNIKQIVGEA